MDKSLQLRLQAVLARGQNPNLVTSLEPKKNEHGNAADYTAEVAQCMHAMRA